MIKTELSKQECLSHECTVCGKQLRLEAGKWETLWMIIVGVVVIGGAIFLMFFDKPNYQTDCFKRVYLSGRGTDLEMIKTEDIKCPN